MHDQRTTFRRTGTPGTPPAARLGMDIREAAAMIGVSYMTLWRAIREDQFPGVKLRDRIIVPVKAVEMLLETATQSGELIDAAAWTAAWRSQAVTRTAASAGVA
jgi:hypothetical protein